MFESGVVRTDRVKGPHRALEGIQRCVTTSDEIEEAVVYGDTINYFCQCCSEYLEAGLGNVVLQPDIPD